MNEDQVGEGLLASGVPRTAVVLTSKYQSLHADQGGKLGCGFGVRGDVFRSLNASLARLRTTFLDVYLVHFPTPVVLRNGQLVEAHCGVGTMLAERRATVWREMIEARRTGLVSPTDTSTRDARDDPLSPLSTCALPTRACTMPQVRAIGVSNWRLQLAELAELEAADEYPTVYQGEFSPFYRNEEVRRYLAARGSVTFVAYGALLRSLYVNWWGATRASKRFRAEFEKLASQRGVSTVQLMLQYSTQHGHAVITKSSSAVHLKSNLQATCNLTEADLELLNSAPQLPKGYGHAFGPFAQSVPGALKPRASTTTSASRNPGERGEWRILESLNGQGTDLKHPQPMRAVVRGEAAAVVVRNAFSAQDVSDVLQRLHERRLWESDGSLGSAALAAKSHGKPFRNYPHMTEIGHTIHTFGLGTRNWQRATTAFREQYVGSLFNNIVDPWSRFQTILNALARGSGKVVAPPKNFTGLPGSRGIPGIFRANRPRGWTRQRSRRTLTALLRESGAANTAASTSRSHGPRGRMRFWTLALDPTQSSRPCCCCNRMVPRLAAGALPSTMQACSSSSPNKAALASTELRTGLESTLTTLRSCRASLRGMAWRLRDRMCVLATCTSSPPRAFMRSRRCSARRHG